MSNQTKLGRYYAKRVWIRRFITAGVVVVLVLMRSLVGCNGGDKQPGTSQPVSEERSIDDFSRYNELTVSCVKVLDGDTADVNIPDLKAQKNQAYTRIRFWGIDTPEIDHGPNKPAMYFGYEAAEFARKQLLGKKVRLEMVQGKTRDRYGRLLAYIHLPDGQMYNRLALTNGFAYADYRFKHPYIEEFFGLEASARKNLAGLWKQVQPDQLPYWYKKAGLKNFWQARDTGKPIPESSLPAQKKSKNRKSTKSIGW
jgi:micrococcal nuclease